jgi:hypothetical protein
MSYIYLQPVELEEHMLFATEIAEIYTERLKYTSMRATPSEVHSIIKKYYERRQIEIPRFYYPTKKGVTRVYSKDIYEPAMEDYYNMRTKQR